MAMMVDTSYDGTSMFEDLDWRDLLQGVRRRTPVDYAVAFYDAAREAQQEGRADHVQGLRLLGDACSYSLRLDQSAAPFAPSVGTPAVDAASPKELSDSELESLQHLAPQVEDAVLRARLADIVWVLRRDYQMAEIAVEAYLERAGNLVASGDEPPRGYRNLRDLERALQIARQLGRRNPMLLRTVEEIQRIQSLSEASEARYLPRDLVRLAREYEVIAPLTLFDTAARIAESAEAAEDWTRAADYWEEAAACAVGDAGKRREAYRRVAETYARRAEQEVPRPHVGLIQAVAYLQKAIEALRRAGNSRERVDELHRRMVELQSGIPEALQAFTHRIDISDAVAEGERAIEQALEGKPFLGAMISFAALMSPQNRRELERRADEIQEKYLFRRVFPVQQHAADGSIVARQSNALRDEMLILARRQQSLMAQVVVAPGRLRLVRDHVIRIHELVKLVVHSPFVPQGREMLYAEGLYAGFVGDMPKAVHILVHQLEHSIRELLTRTGALTTNLNNYQIQTQQNLNKLLFLPELNEILGEDLVFALQGLLVEAFGSNLRNRVAHGLMQHDEFFGPDCLYLWWLCIRICCLPIAESAVE